MKNTTMAIDLAKSVFEIGISDRPGHVDRNHRLSRTELCPFLAAQPPATVVMEACSSLHYWGRKCAGFGHDVKLLPPRSVRPYVQRSKTDRTDVKGILEASRNSDIHPVPVKTESQQQLTSLHRIRSTPPGGFCQSLASFFRLALPHFLVMSWRSLRTPTPRFRWCCGTCSINWFWKSVNWNPGSRPPKSISPLLPSRLPSSNGSVRFPASGYSRRRRWSVSSAMSPAFLPAAISPAIWNLRMLLIHGARAVLRGAQPKISFSCSRIALSAEFTRRAVKP